VTQPQIGGFQSKRVQLSLFVRDFLANGQESYAGEIYTAYKETAQAIPLYKSKRKRKVASYGTFRNYMWMFRTLGLIEYLRDASGEIDTEEAQMKGGVGPAPHLAPKHYIQAVMSKISDPAWQNPARALYG